MLRILAYLLTLLALYLVAQFCERETEGFTLSKLSTHLLDKDSPSLDESYLRQRFHYLAKGGQNYVFLSEDGRFVLKFLRSSRLHTLHFFYSLFPLKFLEEKISLQEKSLEQTLKSYELAYQLLKKETGLLSLHFSRNTPLLSPLKIVDKLGIEHTLDPNLYPFILQERAILVKDKIQQLMESNDEEGARRALHSLFALLKTRMAKGMEDRDPNLSKNFGFLGDTPIQIDGGCFSLTSSPSLEKIQESTEDLHHWINRYYPNLSNDFIKAYETL